MMSGPFVLCWLDLQQDQELGLACRLVRMPVTIACLYCVLPLKSRSLNQL